MYSPRLSDSYFPRLQAIIGGAFRAYPHGPRLDPVSAWKLRGIILVILVFPRSVQPEGTAVLIRVAWFGIQLGALSHAH